MISHRSTLCGALLGAGLRMGLGSGAAWSQDISKDLGDLPAGKQVTIKYSVQIKNPLDSPAGATQVSTQGTITGDNIAAAATDDSDTVAADDPTVTPLTALSNPFDVDGDGDVDGQDISAAVACYGQPAACNPAADVNNDGTINILDISLIGNNFT